MSVRFVARLLVLALVASLMGACSSGRSPSTYLVATDGPYLLDTGDVVRVTVYGDDKLTNSYTVDDRGFIAFPLVGPIAARGSTTQATAARITAALANGFMRAPNVAVEVAQYRPFFIQGEVLNAGQFPYVYGMTVRAAVSTAGGFKDTADRGRALIYRRQGDSMSKGNVDLDFPIYPGDTIVIQDRWL